MQGTIAVSETRNSINQISAYYQGEYKRLLEKEKNVDKTLNDSNNQIALAGTAAKVGLAFTSPIIRGLGRFAVWAGVPIIKWINKIKANKEKDIIKSEKERVKAEFIAETGSSELYDQIESGKIDFETPQEELGGRTL